MTIEELRYALTEHKKKFFFTYENSKFLIHPSITIYRDLLNKIMDDLELIPQIKKTWDNTDIKFYKFDYNENIYSKSELLAFIFASIDKDWNIIEGLDINTGNSHFWLQCDKVIFDPSLAIITNEEVYYKYFKPLNEIKNEDISTYLSKNNNLYKFYRKKSFIFNEHTFSSNFINQLIEKFNKNINKQYMLDEKRIKNIKEHFMLDSFIEFRQVLTQKRKSYLQSNNISVHPSIDNSILIDIEKSAQKISELMKKEYNLSLDYHINTLYNCYGLSILFNLYDENFKLIQGGIPYQRQEFNIQTSHFYQHSWLEKDDFVYDPALRIITPKDLYYKFVQKQDEYSKEETENILRRIGFNLTHFRDFMSGKQIGNNESIMYRFLVNKIDSPELNEEGEKLITLIRSIK